MLSVKIGQGVDGERGYRETDMSEGRIMNTTVSAD